jgi:uracil phosphoribosyltransferase
MSKHKLTQKKVVTPNGIFSIEKILDNEPCFIPVLRAGVFMLPGALKIFPNASVDFIGIGRDHNTLEPKEYLDLKGVPSSKDKTYYILDPMVATGGSIIYVIDKLKKIGIQDKNIRILCIFTCPEGIMKIRNKYPNIHISCVTIDKKLNEQGYIIPGLGDAGKRLSGTNS